MGKKYIVIGIPILNRPSKHVQFPEPMLALFKELQALFITQKNLLYPDNTLVSDSEKTELSSVNILRREVKLAFPPENFLQLFLLLALALKERQGCLLFLRPGWEKTPLCGSQRMVKLLDGKSERGDENSQLWQALIFSCLCWLIQYNTANLRSL